MVRVEVLTKKGAEALILVIFGILDDSEYLLVAFHAIAIIRRAGALFNDTSTIYSLIHTGSLEK